MRNENFTYKKLIFSRYSSTNVPSNIGMRIQENHIKFVDTFKLLGVTIDRELNFDNHISIVCNKVNHKCTIISRNAYLFSSKF